MPAFERDTRLVSDISKGRSLRIIEHIKRVKLGNQAHIHFTYSLRTCYESMSTPYQVARFVYARHSRSLVSNLIVFVNHGRLNT